MSTQKSISHSDIKLKGSDFSFTEKLSKFARNDEWVKSYNDLEEGSDNNKLSTVWKVISTGSEELGNKFYTTIKNYIDNIGNVDTCGIKALLEYCNTLKINNEYLNIVKDVPLEIRQLIEVLSVNRAYLYNKSTDGSTDTLVLSNTILHYSTVEQFLESLNDYDKFKELIHNCFYNTIMEFLNLKNVTFEDKEHNISPVEIWRTDINAFTTDLWKSDVDTEYEISKLKQSLSVDKSFTEKIYADDIISGIRKLTDFNESEQIVIKAEMEHRKGRYNTSNSMKYYYARLYKVLEYFRFCSSTYNSVYKLKNYELFDTKYIVDSSKGADILKCNYSGYEINTLLIHEISDLLTDATLNISKFRNEIKTQSQKNMMVGTKRLIIDLIREYLLEKIDEQSFNYVKNNILQQTKLNKNFTVDLIEYVDTTDYFNIENVNDMVSPNDHTLKPRYWEYGELNNAISYDDELSFVNRIIGDEGKRYEKNTHKEQGTGENLNDFLTALFETGATSNSVSDLDAVSENFESSGNTDNKKSSIDVLSEDGKSFLKKHIGNFDKGDAPYTFDKNTLHPSYQMLPFLRAFEEYNKTYSTIVNMVNSYTENLQESINRLSKRLDNLGNTINFWYSWNDDFTGYSTTHEKSSNDMGKINSSDSPFNFDALNDYLFYNSEYISNITYGINKYYINQHTGKSILDEDEMTVEIARLQKYYDKIKDIANKEIYKYGKDYNGNVYILYKDTGNRHSIDAMGDIWVRLKNHPIAFPLFDITTSPSVFNDISCLSETDNNKLIEVLKTILSRFNDTYGTHYTSYEADDSDIIPRNICATYGEYSDSKYVTKDKYDDTKKVYPTFEYSYDNFKLSENKLKLVYSLNPQMDSFVRSMDEKTIENRESLANSDIADLLTTEYFVDSVTEEILDDTQVDIEVYEEKNGVSTKIPTLNGKILSIPDNTILNAIYDRKENTFSVKPHTEKYLLFADYSDDIVVENGVYYNAKDIMRQDDNTTHPCTKHRITISKLYKLSVDAFKGTVDKDGNVHFGGDVDLTEVEDENNFTTYKKEEVSEEITVFLDGGGNYEDFSQYEYYYYDNVSGKNKTVAYKDVIMVGGCNPYYREYDNKDNPTMRKLSIKRDTTNFTEKFILANDLYKTDVMPYYDDSFSYSECKRKTTVTSIYSDSVGQFSHDDNPYVYYQPYVEIEGGDFLSLTAPTAPYGVLKTFKADGSLERIFYYKIKDGKLRRKYVTYKAQKVSVSMSTTKLHGTFELEPRMISEHSILLTFDNNSTNNIAKYSSIGMFQDQKKFFDFGFSYNSKLFYMTYYNNSDKYLDSGVIIGKLKEKPDSNNNQVLVFNRDASHNLEYIDSNSFSVSNIFNGVDAPKFHIGDTSFKGGIVSAFGAYNNQDKDNPILYISLSLITDSEVYDNRFNIKLKYGLYEFDKGEKYSFKLSTTDSRVYISFTSNTPSNNDIIANAVNYDSIGGLGSSKFEDIKNGCGDCSITVLSFDITEYENVEHIDSETRYIMQCGDVGYINQYGGINGKNLIFERESLKYDNRFSFKAQFEPLTGSISETKMYDVASAKLNDFKYDDLLMTYGKYIPLHSDIDGIIISDDNDSGLVLSSINESSEGCNATKVTNFGKRIYDVSRGTYSDVQLIADGDNNDIKISAFINGFDGGVDVNGAKLSKITVHSNLGNFYNTDYVEFAEDVNALYALGSDGHTLSRLSINTRDADSILVPKKGVVLYEQTPDIVVKTIADRNALENVSVGYICKVLEDESKEVSIYVVYEIENNTNGDKTIKWKKYTPTHINFANNNNIDDGFTSTNERGGAKYFIAYNYSNKKIYYFGLGGETDVKVVSNVRVEAQYKPIGFIVDNNPYFIEFKNIIEDSVYYSVKPFNNDGSVASEIHSIHFDKDDPVIGIADTTNDNEKVICTKRGGVYKYLFNAEDENNRVTILRTFESIRNGSVNYDYRIGLHDSYGTIFIPYKGENGSGVLYLRKTVYESIGEKCTFLDTSGNKMDDVYIVKMLSENNTVLAKDEITGYVFISTDGGNIFKPMPNSIDHNMTLVGCGNQKFYAYYDNNEIVYSTNGYDWVNDINIPFSNWIVCNANGNDYLLCSAYDEDLKENVIDTSKYVNVDKIFQLDNDFAFDGIVCNQGIVVAYSGIDGTHPFTIARLDLIDDTFKYYTFNSVRGFEYNKGHCYGNDLFFPPDGGVNVLKFKNIFNTNVDIKTEYIDISSCMNMSISKFGGFATVDGRFLMYPLYGDRVLCYNDYTNTFYNILTFDVARRFCGMGVDISTDSTEAILPSCVITKTDGEDNRTSGGAIEIVRTKFNKDINYGLVEIDEGFPIQITYNTVKSKVVESSKEYDISILTFNFINDKCARSISITTRPNIDKTETDYDKIMEIFNRESMKSGIYISNDKSVCYKISTVDDSLKYVIEKIYDYNFNNVYSDLFNIEYRIDSQKDRESIAVDYEGTGVAYVYSEEETYKTDLT